MFKLESYITPILLNHLAKYVKNIRPQDAQVSLWEGEVMFQNLDLRLDVLEEELNLPFEFLSGHIHELSIHVPWTKITSEPIRITINTIEFALKLKDARTEGTGSSASSSPQRVSNDPQKRKRISKQEEQQQAQQSMGMGLVNKIINNISLECHNIILKYVEEDIVVSMNVQLLSIGSADENWKYGMVDVHPTRVFMRKLVQISDLTICLDKRNAAGQIDVCQEPILYRCTLECRILRKYNVNTATTTSTLRMGIFTKSIDMNISSLQFPMAMRLIKLIMALKSGKIENPSAHELHEDELEEETGGAQDQGQGYLSWAWNLLPSFNFEPLDDDDETNTVVAGHTMDIGVYVEMMNFTLKNSELINDTIMGSTKRIRYTPIVRISLGGVYFESVSSVERNWSNIKAGLSGIFVEPLGSYRVDEKSSNTLIETPLCENIKSFIDKSLFDEQCLIADKGWGVTTYEEYTARITDEYLIYRSPVLAFDLIQYRRASGVEDETKHVAGSATSATSDDMHVEYRLLSAGVTFRYNQSFLQVKHVINEFIKSYDYPAYYAEKLNTAGGANGNSPKLHPPLMEDYDALMQYIPLCVYKFDLKNIRIEVYPKVNPDTSNKTQKRLPAALKQTLPHFVMHFTQAEGSMSTPLKPDKLVHTTCQLPDKPRELLDACYNNYHLNLKDLSLSLANKTTKRVARLLHIPKLDLSFGKLLQPQLWKSIQVPQNKLDLNCDQFCIEFSKSELIASERLLSCVLHYRPYLVWKAAKQGARPPAYEDFLKLQNNFSKLCLQLRCYEDYAIWNITLSGMRSEVFVHGATADTPKHVVLTTSAKQHGKWLEWQAQFPSTTEAESKHSVKTAMALWLDPFHITVNKHLIEYLKYQEEPEHQIERENFSEVEIQTQSLQPQTPPATTSANYTTALSTSSVQPQLVRRSSRNSLPTRKVSQPEETVHLSSERDEKFDLDANVSAQVQTTKEEQLSWLKYIKSLIVNIEIAQSRIDIGEHFEHGALKNSPCDYTQICLPKIVCKSAHAEYIARSNMRQKIYLKDTTTSAKNTLSWTIQLSDLSLFNVVYGIDNTRDVFLHPVQTTITIAFTHKKEELSAIREDHKYAHEKTNKATKKIVFKKPDSIKEQNRSHSPISGNALYDGVTEDASSVGSLVMSASPLNDEKPDSYSAPDKSKKSAILVDCIIINLHADTTPIRFCFTAEKIKNLQKHLNLLLKVLQLIQPIAQSSSSNAPAAIVEPLKILSQGEENPKIKEFLDLETNSESSFITDEKIPIAAVISLFYQWTITKIILEFESVNDLRHSKIILELEDLLATVDKREDFTKYTAKVGHFHLNYFETNSKSAWQPHECLRMKMLGETTNLPFFNIIVTCVGLKDFYKRIGAKRKGDFSRSLSEILITMQAVEIIVDLDRVTDVMTPLYFLFNTTPSDSVVEVTGGPQEMRSTAKPLIAADLPLIHFDSKGFTLYTPLEASRNKSCSVLIWKIEHIKITPYLENPLQRNPIRTDVYSKAVQMGILGTPGSLVEDRQYELTLKNISAVSGNWHEILTHMRDQTNNFHRTNPAFEWNNQNRKTSLQLTDLFNNFTFMTIYAPCIAYDNILICGQAIEFNCTSDFVVSLNMDQLNLLSCLGTRLQNLSNLTSSAGSITKQQRTVSSSFKSVSESFLHDTNYSTANYHRNRLSKLAGSQQRRSTLYHDARSSSMFGSIDEDAEHNGNTDSGFQSILSRTYSSLRPSINSRERYASLSSNASCTQIQERADVARAPVRCIPHTMSLVAGIFLIKLFDIKQPTPAKVKESFVGQTAGEPLIVPLIAVTITQPSFMITQNIYDSVRQASLYNLHIHLSAKDTLASFVRGKTNLFPEVIFDTRLGELAANGIPPPLFNLKCYRTKMNLLELDVDISKVLLLSLKEEAMPHFCRTLLKIYSTVLENPCFKVHSKAPVVRASKIKLIRLQCFNADRLHLNCEKIIVRFSRENDYNIKLVCSDTKLNMKFLSRPEKATVKASFGALYLQTDKKILVHPIALRLSADFVNEQWHRLPLVIVTAKFNVVHIDLGVYNILQLRQAQKGLDRVTAYFDEEWRAFLKNRPPEGVGEMQRERLNLIKCPSLVNCKGEQKNSMSGHTKRQQREEFYQDDLRAGAFQFVEMVTDTFLPLPYQIQIIKKNFGVICWRYPQPRKMCKIHIFPVPMAVPNPIHIKCRMEYFSEVHECFLYYCDFWLSETISKDIVLPEREVCANIWRVVILQSVVSVNGDCFDTSEEDEELHAITSIKIEEVLNSERKESDFILHPRVLVGCMRIDTSFQSTCVPKMQLLVSCNLLHIKLLNQPIQNAELPSLIKKFHLTETKMISQVFLKFNMGRINFHAAFLGTNNYTINASSAFSIKCIDFGYLNFLYLLEETSMESYIRVNNVDRNIFANIVLDKLRLNVGPSLIHALLSSKLHWEEYLDPSVSRKRYAFIPKCIVVNRTYSYLSFGQTGTTERIHLQPKECHLYWFRSDYHSQELTFFIADDETHITNASQSVPISFKLDDTTAYKPIRIGNKCIVIKSRRVSSSQIIIFIKGQIELISMVPHDLLLEFRRDDKHYNEKNLIEYKIDSRGRGSFYHSVQTNSNVIMRLKFANNKGKLRTGDIPLKKNKNLPWLVKVPTTANDFISIWVRILREDVPEIRTDTFQPQRIFISIWPIFTMLSMLSCPVEAHESTTDETFTLPEQAARRTLNVPATHLTEHNITFKYNFPISSKSKDYCTLTLKTMEWNKFFWYDEKVWHIEEALQRLSKPYVVKWPLNDDEELRVERYSSHETEVHINYKCYPMREFSCTTCLEVAPWGLFINATSLEVSIYNCATKQRTCVSSNCLEMLFAIEKSFTVDITQSSNWVQSMPIYFEQSAVVAGTSGGSYGVLSEGAGAGIDLLILRGDEVLTFVLELRVENERKLLILRSKFALTNFTRTKLCVIPFAMDHKENASREDVTRLDAAVLKSELIPVESRENCIGLAVDSFYDLNAHKAKRSIDTAFVYFVCLKICYKSKDFSIPIPLAMPFTRRCFSIQNGSESLALVVTLIEHNGVYYLNIFDDVAPAILLSNQTDVELIVAQTSASENSQVSNTTPEYYGRHFEWFQMVPAYSDCYYTPPEMYASFPDVESTMCNLTIALYNENATKKNIKWSKPIRTDKTWEKFLHIPKHGDVKVMICDKHRVKRVSIYYIAQQMEFSVKDLRSRLQMPAQESPDTSDSTLVASPSGSLVVKPDAPPVTKCIHLLEECGPSKTQWIVRFYVKEALLSLHTNSKDSDFMKSEICCMYFDELMLAYNDDDDRRQLNMLLANLQIDNQLYSSGKYDFPVVLCSQKLYERSAVVPSVHYLERTYQELRKRSPMAWFVLNFFDDEMKLSSIKCDLSPIRVYIEDAYLNDLLEALVECEPTNCVYKPSEEHARVKLTSGQVLLPREVAAQAICIAEPLHLRSFRIEALDVLLSVHTSVRLYIALDHSPLSFSTYEREHVLTMPLRFGQSLGMHYLSGAIFGAGWVVGSLEILGSPSGLARSFTTGLRDFVSMPVQGLFRGPWGFIVGITQGSASLLRNVTAGTVNSVTKLAASVARNLDRLTLDPEHIERTEALRRSRPQGFTEGFSQGITGLGISILGAVGGIARHTLEARSPVQVVTGVGKGIVGAFTKPISGAVELVALAGQGMLHTVGFNAMPEQRAPSICSNIAIEPAGFRIWQLLPDVLVSDQLLFYHEVTLVLKDQMSRGFVFLTSTVFVIMEAQWDKLAVAVPIDKVELQYDRDDKSLIYVHLTTPQHDIDENINYTNQRIISFLNSSNNINDNTVLNGGSLWDMLKTPTDGISLESHPSDLNRNEAKITWAFYISEHLGEHLKQYLKIMNKMS